mmetsp:Transcript_76259/g.223555  ORF Transcript_76259/g.223555 Transcript_76259/m.223555 type:complete len:460 (+) Transcript_76259:2501-3880(+)
MVRGLHEAGLVLRVPEKVGVEAHHLAVIAQATVVMVAVLEGNQVRISVLGEVEVRVEARVRHVGVGVGGGHVHGACFLEAPGASAREAAARHDVGARALRHEGPHLDVQDICVVLGVRHKVSQRDLRRCLEEPGLQRQVLALGLELEGHEVGAEDEEPVLLHGHGHGLHLQVGPRMQRDAAPLIVHKVEEGELPAPDELDVSLQHALLVDVIVVQGLRHEGALLAAAGEGHPDHALSLAVGVEAQGVPGHGAHDSEHVNNVRVVALKVVAWLWGGPHLHVVHDLEGIEVGDLPLALPPEEVRQELLLGHVEVLAPGPRERLRAGLLALEGLDEAPVLCGEDVVHVCAEVKQRGRIVGPADVEAALRRQRRLKDLEVLLSNVQVHKVKGADDILPRVLAPVHGTAPQAVDLDGRGAMVRALVQGAGHDGALHAVDRNQPGDELPREEVAPLRHRPCPPMR